MTHSGGKSHKVGDDGQRFEVSYFDPNDNIRKPCGWTNDAEVAGVMASSISGHPSWQSPYVTDRRPCGDNKPVERPCGDFYNMASSERDCVTMDVKPCSGCQFNKSE